MFKAIKRRLIRCHLRGSVKHVDALAESSDADYIQRKIAQHPGFRAAWAFLLWWQAGASSVSLRDWLNWRRRQSMESIGAWAPFERFQLIDRFPAFRRLGDGATTWQDHWLAAACYLDMWSRAARAADRVGGTTKPEWGRGIVEVRAPHWSSAIDQRGRFCLEFEKLGDAGLRTTQRRDKISRKLDEARRRESIRASCCSQRVLYAGADSGWRVAGPLEITNPRSLKLHRMRVDGRKLRFVIVPNEQAFLPDLYWASAHEVPVASAGTSPSDAISNLKTAVRQYTQKYDT
ncbi:hypothetical protein [Rhizobacter sp. LjRoot28]|uniref:hypothetical protein n=1 Tax=Rhizobacter sp. LjRoot28 TaxID=3342309 RepID=UPI003ECF5396